MSNVRKLNGKVIPSAPAHLLPQVAEIWRETYRIVQHMAGSVTPDRLLLIDAYAQERAVELAHVAHVDKDGDLLTLFSERGEMTAIKAHPSIAIASAARAKALKLAKCLDIV